MGKSLSVFTRCLLVIGASTRLNGLIILSLIIEGTYFI